MTASPVSGFVAPVHLVNCPNCKTLKLPHRVCFNCGMYKGRQVIASKAANS